MGFAVQRLGPNDVARVRAMNAMMGGAFEDTATYTADPPADAYLARILAKPDVAVLVAVEGDAVIGGLVAYAFDKFEQARREIYIYDLAVAEAHRRRGIATALIARLQAIAAEEGAWVIFVQADHGDDPAIALYESWACAKRCCTSISGRKDDVIPAKAGIFGA